MTYAEPHISIETGDIVICINRETSKHGVKFYPHLPLTIDKKYTVEGVMGDANGNQCLLLIVNDEYQRTYYNYKQFITIDVYREKQLNELGI
jgi:hypothetical protein